MKKEIFYKGNIFALCILLLSGCGSDVTSNCSDYLANNHSVIDGFSVELQSLDSSDQFVTPENSWLHLMPVSYIEANGGIAPQLTQKKAQPYFSLFKTAHATSCVRPAIEEKIVSINIVSDADYNNDFLAGDSLNTLFYSTLDLTLEEDLYSSEIHPHGGFDLFIKEMPILDKNHTFTIEMALDNGDQFIINSSPVEFQ